jgi:flagellar basal-body rod protein FlgF
MVRGMHTAASGMLARWYEMDVIANNLANVDKTAFKRDQAVFKSFPQMLLRRVQGDGLVHFPLGSYDIAPVIGKVGTGVEVNDIATSFEQGLNMKRTTNPLDLALEGEGFFTVWTERGERFTRNGSFQLDSEGYLVTKEGYHVLNEYGDAIQLQNQQFELSEFRVDEFGKIEIRRQLTDDFARMGGIIDEPMEYYETQQLKLVNFFDPRELVKEGSSLYRATRYSGMKEFEGNQLMLDQDYAQLEIGQGGRPKVRQGFLETSNVNPIHEMVRMISAHRAYEANSKAAQTSDGTLGRLINEVGRT